MNRAGCQEADRADGPARTELMTPGRSTLRPFLLEIMDVAESLRNIFHNLRPEQLGYLEGEPFP